MSAECPFLVRRGMQDHSFLTTVPVTVKMDLGNGNTAYDSMDIPTCLQDGKREVGVNCMSESHVNCDEFKKQDLKS